RRDLFREMAPSGTFEQMTPEERQRVGREVNQRLMGIVQGLQLGAVELQKKAEAQRHAAGVGTTTEASTPAVPQPQVPGAAQSTAWIRPVPPMSDRGPSIGTPLMPGSASVPA